MRKVAIAGCKHTTFDLIKSLLGEGFKIDYVITIDESKALDQKVAGYYNLGPFLEEQGIPFYVAHNYSLTSKRDEAAIRKMGLDILLCSGWQRLIPEWFLASLSVGAFGMHGSNKPLPHGRGRSPLNWSIIQGRNMFFTHLFRYKPGVDDGDVVGYQLFDITEHDTALTLHYKNLLSMIRLCLRHLPDFLDGVVHAEAQPDIAPSYYPKRTAEDGIIHWFLSTADIYNLIRAVTFPFPGAFSFVVNDNALFKIRILRAIPFDTHIRWDGEQPGTICEVFFDGSFVVKTGDTSLLVQEFEGGDSDVLYKGTQLHSNGIKQKEWPNLPN